MEEIKKFFESISYMQIIKSIIIVIISIMIYKIITHLISKGEKNSKLNLSENRKRNTYFKLTKSLLRYIFLIVTILILLQVNGVNVGSLLAGVGILSAIIGLALQDFLKDIIRGTSILSDDYFSVGDVVKYKDIEGRVLVIGLKSTKIKDLKTGNIETIANRNIEEIQLISNLVYVNIPMSYELPVEEAEKVCNEIVTNIKKDNKTEECRYLGVNDLGSSSVNYLLEITCNPLNRLIVRRNALKSILTILEKNNINVPYQQIDIHNKK